jgi:alpha-mannosidase
MEKIKAIIVPETHWDREWVMTQGQFQIRLVQLMDRLMEILDQNPQYCFLFDGQAIVLEDYLEIKPEQRTRLASYLKSGQITAGPWYVLADQFLENGESTIRNLMMGSQLIRDSGGRPMSLGYVPDSFGSIASLPTILGGFNIKYATFGRGRPYWNRELPHYEFWWDGPDGSRVLTASHAYGGGMFLSYPDIWVDIFHLPPQDPEETLKNFIREAERQQMQAAAPVLYFPVGVDHMEPKASLPGLVDYINCHQDRYELVFGTTEDYMKAVEEYQADLCSYAGEMRGSDEYPMDLIGTLTSRIYLKQANDRCEILLQRVVEPICMMASLLAGAEYPKGHIRKMWKLLLANHPHDSICGCSLDQVHRDMQNRFEQLAHTGNYLVKEGVHQLQPKIKTMYIESDAVALTVINPLGRNATAPVHALVRVPKRFNHSEYMLVDEKGNEVPGIITHNTDKQKDLESVYMTNDLLSEVISKNVSPDRADDQVFTVLDVDFIASQVPGTGYKTWWIKPGKTKTVTNPGVSLCPEGMENQHLRVAFNPDGTFNLVDKHTLHTYQGLNYYVDREDTGDTYDHHCFDIPHEEDSRNSMVHWEASFVSQHRITYKGVLNWSLPEGIDGSKRSDNHIDMPLSISVTLYDNIARVDVTVELSNTCRDHCLRMVLDTRLQTEVISAYEHFQVLQRKAGKTGKEWRDSPFQEFLDVSDSSRGICLMTRGLPAYEGVVSEKGLKLYLPLLRAVGSIGPAAGANHPVPEAQCPGVHRFEYALMPHKGDWREGDCIGSAMNYRNPMIVEADMQHSGEYPSSAALYTIESADTHPVITCLKQAESEEGAVLRLWNPGEDQKVHIHPMKAADQAYMAFLDETKAKKVNPARDGIQLSPNGLTTLIFRQKSRGRFC